MTIADMASYVMHFGANIAENYPEVYSSYETIEALKVVDKVAERLGEDALEISHDIAKVLEALDAVYILGSLSIIDAWIDEFDNGTFYGE